MRRKNGRRCKSKHRKCWILGQAWLWCYECGSILPNDGYRSKWTYPVGPDAPNPALKD